MSDAELRMFAFYAVRGYSLSELAETTSLERRFLHHSMMMYYEDVNKAFGGERLWENQ